jgi:SAM-dependent methyltransferase
MESVFTEKEKGKIQKAIRKKYAKVAKKPEGLFNYPTGRPGLEALHYESDLIAELPQAVSASYCGVGNPFTLGPINPGEAVLDIGCGAGVDAILAAMMTGASGKVFGIELIPEMLKRAEENLALTGLKNVTLKQAAAENLPFADREFDVVISNGVFNLVPDKNRALSEVRRVLKPEGRLMMADQILIGELPQQIKQIIKSWSR